MGRLLALDPRSSTRDILTLDPPASTSRASRAPRDHGALNPDHQPSLPLLASLDACRRHSGAVVQGRTEPDPDEQALLAAPYRHTQNIRLIAGAGDRTYSFHHILMRDAVYSAVPKERRARDHERFGAALERRSGDRGHSGRPAGPVQ